MPRSIATRGCRHHPHRRGRPAAQDRLHRRHQDPPVGDAARQSEAAGRSRGESPRDRQL